MFDLSNKASTVGVFTVLGESLVVDLEDVNKIRTITINDKYN